MQVKSIAECSKGSILQYFRPSLSYRLSLRSLFCLFLSDRFRQVLLYKKTRFLFIYNQSISLIIFDLIGDLHMIDLCIYEKKLKWKHIFCCIKHLNSTLTGIQLLDCLFS